MRYFQRGGLNTSLNMSGPSRVLALDIRSFVSSAGAASRQPSLESRNIEVIDSRAHLGVIMNLPVTNNYSQT